MGLKLLGFLLIITFSLFVGWYYTTTNSLSPQNSKSIALPSSFTTPVDALPITAGFLIFTRGIKRDFSDPRYHAQSPDVFLAADNSTAVHVEKPGVTWQQFFDTLPAPFRVTKKCLYTGTSQTFCTNSTKTLTFFLNGTTEENALDTVIKNGDKLLVSYGEKNEEVIKKQFEQIPNP